VQVAAADIPTVAGFPVFAALAVSAIVQVSCDFQLNQGQYHHHLLLPIIEREYIYIYIYILKIEREILKEIEDYTDPILLD
jgi:hypothetical protein